MSSILEEAQELIYGAREQTYGHPSKNLEAIAALWESYLHAKGLWNENSPGLRAEDVALMMILLKVARLATSPTHHDSQVDICGYAALLERIQDGSS